VSMWKMMEEWWEMVNNAIQQNTQLCVQNANLMDANQEYYGQSIRPEETTMQISDMNHPERYWGGVHQHDNFLDMLQSNFQSHAH
jgi:hypothetical protein